LYEVLLAVHILAAVVWVGGGVTLAILAARVQRRGESQRLVELGRDIEWIGTRVYVPASVLLLLAGIAMVVDAWSFEDAWIVLGIAGFVISMLTGALFIGPESARLAQRLSSEGLDVQTRARLRRLTIVSRLDVLLLLLVVVDMAVKPGV
jgi:uncharacterized membrane protein